MVNGDDEDAWCMMNDGDAWWMVNGEWWMTNDNDDEIWKMMMMNDE